MKKISSVVANVEKTKKDLRIAGSITVALNEDERAMIADLCAKQSPNEVDIMPLLLIANKMVTGKDV